jgi:hypothetical protein
MQVNYTAGTIIRFKATYTDLNSGNPIDPTEIAFAYTINGGTAVQTIYSPFDNSIGTIIRSAQGSYYIDIDSTGLPGSWTFEWVSKGAGQVAETGAVVVSPDPIQIVWP